MSKFFTDQRVKNTYETRQNEYLGCVNKFSQEAIVGTFPAFIERRNLVKFLSIYDIFKTVLDVPGNFIDLGVYKGYTFFSILHLINTFHPTDRLVKLIGFDTFAGYNIDRSDNSDIAVVSKFNKTVSKGDYEKILDLIDLHELNAPLSGIKRVEIIKGNVEKTLPLFKSNNKGMKFKFVSCDLNIYKPTVICLDHLHSTISVGGVILFYAYAQSDWSETQAVDEFLNRYAGHYEVAPLNSLFTQPRLLLRKIK